MLAEKTNETAIKVDDAKERIERAEAKEFRLDTDSQNSASSANC
jgi:hypothetical protein